jgi:hypothetical protein
MRQQRDLVVRNAERADDRMKVDERGLGTDIELAHRKGKKLPP